MKKRQIIITLLIALPAVIALFVFSNHCDKEAVESKDPPRPGKVSRDIPVVSPQKDNSTAAKPNSFQALAQTEIEFYGIVLDQDGSPVPSAKVSGSVLDSWKGTPISVFTGNDGKFTIISKGTAIHLKVEKPGYYRVEKGGDLRPSTQGFDFGVEDSPRAYKTDQASPATFHLKKAGNPVSLERLTANPKLPRDGTPITFSPSKRSSVSLQISCRTMEDDTQPPTAPYDWRCEVVVQGGGIQEARDKDAFEAPAAGYAPSIVINMPKTLDAKKWDSRASKIYWLHFADNTFAKIDFRMHARGDHFAVIDGYRNPTPNDRNLEPKLDHR